MQPAWKNCLEHFFNVMALFWPTPSVSDQYKALHTADHNINFIVNGVTKKYQDFSLEQLKCDAIRNVKTISFRLRGGFHPLPSSLGMKTGFTKLSVIVCKFKWTGIPWRLFSPSRFRRVGQIVWYDFKERAWASTSRASSGYDVNDCNWRDLQEGAMVYE